ncbi:hypothetical protein Tco_1263144 [Tanacetum coccineum]
MMESRAMIVGWWVAIHRDYSCLQQSGKRAEVDVPLFLIVNKTYAASLGWDTMTEDVYALMIWNPQRGPDSESERNNQVKYTSSEPTTVGLASGAMGKDSIVKHM